MLASDFDLAGLNDAAFGALCSQVARVGSRGMQAVADVYPLTSTQEGILFHSVLQAAAGVYCVQTTGILEGPLNAAHFAEAWRHVIGRHAVYRSGYHWEGLERPSQVVYREVAFDIPIEDWSPAPEQEQQARLETFLASDRERGFDLASPPLMRTTLMRLGGGRHRVVWTCHHILIDGWSVAITFREVMAAYAALVDGAAPALPVAPAYRDFVAWRGTSAADTSADYWRKMLGDVSRPTPVPFD